MPVISGGGTVVPTTVVQPHCLPSGHVAHAIQVAQAIKASGLGCDSADLISVAIGAVPAMGTREHPQSDQVDCEIGDDMLSISLYADHTALLTALPEERQGVCFVNRSHPENLSFVEGDNWIVFPQGVATADRLGQALHAGVQTLHCPVGAKP